MIYLLLFFEFFKAGLFSIGGGLATLPFLYDIAARYDWFTPEMLTNMVAVGESTPGPIGINVATYAGFQTAGVLGALIATVGMVTPSIIIVVLISKFLLHFNEKPIVQSAFYGLRPAVAALIVFAAWKVVAISLLTGALSEIGTLGWKILDWKAIILFAVIFVLNKKFSRIHPIAYIAGAAVVGIVLKM